MIKINEPSVIKKEEIKETVTNLRSISKFPYLKSGSNKYGITYKLFVSDAGKTIEEDDNNCEDKDNK